MTREEVLDRIREHLATELEVDPGRIQDSTRFREDLEADSLDLVELGGRAGGQLRRPHPR